MTDDLEKIRRIRGVLSSVDAYSKNERHFDELYKLLSNEYHLEGGDSAVNRMGSYSHNLRQTRDKQAKSYSLMKKK
jgi:hypothetical protein